MAHLPATTDSTPPQPTAEHLAVVEALSRGESVADIARRLHPEDRRARKTARQRIWRMAAKDAVFQQAIADRARAELVAGLPAAARSLSTKAGHGRTDAQKLMFEASGFHNPRVKHEHTGDIKITLDMPRPQFDADGSMADAEVVE